MPRAGRVTMSLKGAKEIQKALLELPGRVAKKVTRQAIRAGLKQVQAAAKANCTDPEIAKAIKVRAWPKRRRGLIALDVIIADKDMDPAKFKEALRTEFGTKSKPAHPFIRPAFDQKGPEAMDETMRLIAEGVERESKALGGPKS